jgi:hypothetical protein
MVVRWQWKRGWDGGALGLGKEAFQAPRREKEGSNRLLLGIGVEKYGVNSDKYWEGTVPFFTACVRDKGGRRHRCKPWKIDSKFLFR